MEIEGQKIVIIAIDEASIIDYVSKLSAKSVREVVIQPEAELEPLFIVQEHKPKYDYQKHNKRRGRK